MECPCGEPNHYPEHYLSPGTMAQVEHNCEVLGPDLKVTIASRSWYVPRIYIALHGIKGWELPQMGFPEASPSVQSAHIQFDQQSLSMWTVYDHPLDYPCGFIARRYETRSTPVSVQPTTDTMTAESLETIRRELYDRGLHCLGREEKDDPKIVETWI